MKYNVSRCAICGSYPQIKKDPLWRQSGGGYPGCYYIIVSCPNEDCVMHCEEFKHDTVYQTEDKATELAYEDWNNYQKQTEDLLADHFS